jgi:LuxR family maltose regulon positive regulatory protein
MPQKKGEAAFEVARGVTISRTLIPVLPPNYISRKNLFPLFENGPGSTTVVIGPAGFGKTSLVAEWILSRPEKVIWLTLTQRDSLADMAALFIQATRNAIPGFGAWFDAEPSMRPVDIVRKWGNDLLATGENYIFVMDNLRENTSKDVDIAARLVEQFPKNLQYVTIRRDSIENVYATFSSRGLLKIIGRDDLALTSEEVTALASVHGISLEDSAIRESISAANGWPSAVSMLMYQIAKNKKPIDFEKIAVSQSEPLRSLAVSVIEQLDPEVRSRITALSVLQEFSHDQAEIILQQDYSHDQINQIALEANYFSQTGSPEQTFEFSKLMREVLIADLRLDPLRKKQIHERLLRYHEDRNEPYLALEHAYLSENHEKVGTLFPDAARVLQSTGRGNELIRWSVFAGDNSPLGLLKRATVDLAGRLANQDFHSVISLADRMVFEAQGTELQGFINQLTNAGRAYVNFSLGKFSAMDENISLALSPVSDPLMLGVEEQIALLRLAAMRHFIVEETEKIEEVLGKAKELATSSKISQSHLMLSSINAMYLFQIGDYRRAYEAASINYTQYAKRSYVGIFGPLDSLFVMARCLLEFARPSEAYEKFVQIRDLAEQWKMWSWHFYADGYLARELAVNGQVTESIENIKSAHQRATQIDFSHQLEDILDMSEVFVRFYVNDLERLGVLLERAPKVRIVEQIRISYDDRMGKKPARDAFTHLPSKTPREKIWKYLVDASEVIDQENLAAKEMKKALEVGALVGAKETFLRQSEEMGNLIIKLAGENPTVYMEDLASAVAERIKRNANGTSEVRSSLTKREIEVLRHLSTDRPISAIAGTLHISINTMKTHLKNLYRKMGVENRTQAVEKAKANFIL